MNHQISSKECLYKSTVLGFYGWHFLGKEGYWFQELLIFCWKTAPTPNDASAARHNSVQEQCITIVMTFMYNNSNALNRTHLPCIMTVTSWISFISLFCSNFAFSICLLLMLALWFICFTLCLVLSLYYVFDSILASHHFLICCAMIFLYGYCSFLFLCYFVIASFLRVFAHFLLCIISFILALYPCFFLSWFPIIFSLAIFVMTLSAFYWFYTFIFISD